MIGKCNVPTVFFQVIQLVSTCDSYNAIFAGKQNFSRPSVKTNYGVYMLFSTLSHLKYR